MDTHASMGPRAVPAMGCVSVPLLQLLEGPGWTLQGRRLSPPLPTSIPASMAKNHMVQKEPGVVQATGLVRSRQN